MSEIKVTTAEMISRIENGYKALQTLLNTWTDEQIVTPGGPDGWSVKDHLAHMAAWERGQAALMRREDRWKAMALSSDTHDIEDMNKTIYANNRDRSLVDVRADLAEAHQQLVLALDSLTDADLLKTYWYYNPDEPGEDDGDPIWPLVVGNSYGHYEEHEPWMKEIIANPGG